MKNLDSYFGRIKSIGKKAAIYSGLSLSLLNTNTSLAFELSRDYVAWRNSNIESKVDEFFSCFDYDLDGKVSQEEIELIRKTPFICLIDYLDIVNEELNSRDIYRNHDINQDGFLTKEELRSSVIRAYDSVDENLFELNENSFEEDMHPR